MAFMWKFGERLSAARKAANLTQEQLADLVHVGRTTISNWENDRAQPDLEALHLMSNLLNVDFFRDESHKEEAPINTEPENHTSPADINASSSPADESAHAQSDSSLDKPGFSKKKVILIAAAVALAVLAACILIIPRVTGGKQAATTFEDSSGKAYDPADYRIVAENDPSKAYLSISPVLEIQNSSNGGHFMYSFNMREVNGIGFHIDRMDHVNFFYAGSVTIDTITADDVIAWGENPDLPPYGTYELQCGVNAKTPSGEPNAIGAGFRVYGTDANGEQLSFTAYLPLPQD